MSPFLSLEGAYRLNSDHVAMANGGMHASSGGSETDSEAEGQQLGTEVAKMTKTRR